MSVFRDKCHTKQTVILRIIVKFVSWNLIFEEYLSDTTVKGVFSKLKKPYFLLLFV